QTYSDRIATSRRTASFQSSGLGSGLFVSSGTSSVRTRGGGGRGGAASPASIGELGAEAEALGAPASGAAVGAACAQPVSATRTRLSVGRFTASSGTRPARRDPVPR